MTDDEFNEAMDSIEQELDEIADPELHEMLRAKRAVILHARLSILKEAYSTEDPKDPTKRDRLIHVTERLLNECFSSPALRRDYIGELDEIDVTIDELLADPDMDIAKKNKTGVLLHNKVHSLVEDFKSLDNDDKDPVVVERLSKTTLRLLNEVFDIQDVDEKDII